MSPPRPRLLATVLPLLAGFAALASPVASSAAANDTWMLLTTPSGTGGAPVTALAADPANSGDVLLGTPGGEIERSTDGGATWQHVAGPIGGGVLVLAFDPIEPSHVLAGTRGAGIWRSEDSGATWHALDNGTETVRSFAFSVGLSAAGTDRGVVITHDGDSWQAADLKDASVAAMAAGAGILYAGADVDHAVSNLPLFSSSDSGATWKQLPGPGSGGTIAGALALASQRLLLGTNAGLYSSTDGGSTWSALSGTGVLPQTDYSAIVPASQHLYVASDGGGGTSGGLWASDDGGQTFRTLAAPIPAVTAVAVSGSTVYSVSFRAADHAPMVWSYVDDGGTPQQPSPGVPPPSLSPLTASPTPTAQSRPLLESLLRGPEAPYLVLGAVAVLVLLLALAAYVRRGRA